MRRGDDDGAERSHRRLGQCLERARRCLRAISAEGMGYGTSDYLVPLSRAERRAEALELAGPVVGDGGAVGVAATREREFAIAAGHAEAVLRAAALS